jgi:hypothetical protein
MELDDVYQSNSIKATDLKGLEHTVVIETVTKKEFDNGSKLILTFQGRKKSLVCNRTNAKRIAFTHGTNTDHWIGREIILYPEVVDFKGEPTLAVRVKARIMGRAPTPEPVRQVSVAAGQVVQERDGYTVSTGAAPHPNAPDNMSDDIPF